MPKYISPVLPAAVVDEHRRPLSQRVPFGVRFIEGGEQSGSESAGAPSGTPAGAGQNKPETTDPGSESEKTFTQAELDRILAGRLSKFSDYDQLKAERDELKTATATDQEKAVAAARKEAVAEATKSADSRLKRAESRGVAAELGFQDPAEAHLFLDLDKVPMVDGEVDVAALKKSLEDVVKTRPYLLKEQKRTHEDAGIGRKGSKSDPGPGLPRLEAAFDAAFATTK